MTIDIKTATTTQVVMGLAKKKQEDLKDVSIQAATGIRHQTFQGFAGDGNVEKLLSFSSTLESTNTFIKSNQIIQSRIGAMVQTMEQLEAIADEAQNLIASRRNSATGSSVPIDILGESMLNDIAGKLNIKFDGRYLFAGSKTNTQPVNNIQNSNLDSSNNPTTSYYSGNSEKVSIKISDSQELEYGITANELAFQQLIGAINLATEGHNNDDNDLLAEANDMINEAIENLVSLTATARASNNIIIAATSTHKSVTLLVEENLGDIVGGFDLITEASIRIAELEATIQATYIAFNKLNDLRLSNFLN